ncbi:hypothetical protein QYF61_014546 [Mycteria americana]|uniref:Uncharacterized protein n=1 Tax=Mycteria americana TaxID=33587 RepID=A0AAN7P0W6_MYCAM|nr:hypothetical protein QYF61_014546 [Mycteria americana]
MLLEADPNKMEPLIKGLPDPLKLHVIQIQDCQRAALPIQERLTEMLTPGRNQTQSAPAEFPLTWGEIAQELINYSCNMGISRGEQRGGEPDHRLLNIVISSEERQISMNTANVVFTISHVDGIPLKGLWPKDKSMLDEVHLEAPVAVDKSMLQQLNVVLIVPHFIQEEAGELLMNVAGSGLIFTLASFKRVLMHSLPVGQRYTEMNPRQL